MRRLLLALILVLLPAVAPAIPTGAIDNATLALTPIHSENIFCSAFAVRVRQYVTASHCLGDGELVTMKDTPTKVIKEDKVNDLALLEINEIRRPLAIGDAPKVGDEVTQVGYGITSKKAFDKMRTPFLYFIPSTIIHLTIVPFNWDGDEMAFYGNGIGGMSGGPVVDKAGKVVSVVTGGGDPGNQLVNIGAGVSYDALKRFLK